MARRGAVGLENSVKKCEKVLKLLNNLVLNFYSLMVTYISNSIFVLHCMLIKSPV